MSARGLWSCVGTKSAFEDWFTERFWRLALREGVDVVPAIMLVNGSTAEAGRAAADLLERLRRDLSDRLANAATVGPLATAALAVAPPVPPPLPDGRFLDVVRRIVGTEAVAVVSARELHALVDPTRQFATWWRRIAKGLALDAGEYYADVVPGRLSSGDHGRSVVDYWLPLRVARKACAGMPPAARDPLVAHLLAWSMAHPPGPAWPSPAPAAVHAIPAVADEPPADGDGDSEAEPADAEPWAEAFDFGRLVPVADREVGGVMQPTVSARDVHTFLGLARQLTNWFDVQTVRCPLVHGTDYEGISNIDVKNPRGGRPRKDYFVGLSAGKKIAMASAGRRGNAVREYFIECERRLLAGEPPIPVSAPATPLPLPAPPTATDHPAVDPLLMSMASYLGARGIPERTAKREATASAPGLAASMVKVDAIDDLRLFPGPGWMFVVAFLDEWWVHNRLRILAALAGPPSMVPVRRHPAG